MTKLDKEILETFAQLTKDERENAMEIMRLFPSDPEEARRRMHDEKDAK